MTRSINFLNAPKRDYQYHGEFFLSATLKFFMEWSKLVLFFGFFYTNSFPIDQNFFLIYPQKTYQPLLKTDKYVTFRQTVDNNLISITYVMIIFLSY